MPRTFNLILLILSIILMPLSLSAINRSGTIEEDETWKFSDSPVIVDDMLTLHKYATLIIEPGVEIRFSDGTGFIVNGRLVARGTPQDSIRFTSAGEKRSPAWGGIYFRGTWVGEVKKEESVDDEFEEEEIFEDGMGNTYRKVGEYYVRQDGKYFYETEEGRFKEYKGEIPVEEELITDALLDTLKTSLLDYCIVEYGGSPIETGSSIEISNSNPIIKRSTIRDCNGETGTIRCDARAKPHISGCLILGNHAVRGGAVSVGLNAKPVLVRNTFAFNRTDDHGGAIYISLASAEIVSNRFIGNEAAGHGGAIYSAISPKLIIRGNSFMNNRSLLKSNALYLTNRFDAEIKYNVFDHFGSMGVELYMQNVLQEVDAMYNFWGDPTTFSFTDLILDHRIDASEPYAYYEPFYWAPPDEHPTNPIRVDSIILCRDDNYSEEIPRGVAEGAPLRIRLAGEDSNPYFRDVVKVLVTSEYDPDGIEIPLRETGDNSGIWIAKGHVSDYTRQDEYSIGGREGGQVVIYAPCTKDVQVIYPTMSPKPLAENLTVANAPPLPPAEGEEEAGMDVLHLVNHTPVLTWGYFDVIESPQLSYKLKVFSTTNGRIGASPIWDTGEILTEEKEVVYTGPELEDGESYITHINVNNDRFWSDTVELLFRMNSLPTAPQPHQPVEDELVPTLTPELFALVSDDREGDSLTYRFEVFPLESDEAAGSASGIKPVEKQVSWTVTDPLVENTGYNFRIKASDPLEEGPWSEYRRFWMNSLEEPTDPYDLKYPIEGVKIYPLHPTLEWETAIDPDPLSFVRYTVEIDKSDAFNVPRIYRDIEPTDFTLPDSIDNVTEYFWRVTAIDNTERKTVSTSVGRFYVDTTPSVPEPGAPLSGEERMPPDELSWEPSTDPNPDDLIFYEIEVYETEKLEKVAAYIINVEEIHIVVEKLNGWEDLVDNHVYFWCVRSRDNHTAPSELSSSSSFFYNRYNDPPAPVEAFSLPPDTVMGTTDILFRWREASDPDLSDPPSTLVYDLECAQGDFEGGEIRTFSTEPGITELVASLGDNLLWHYQIRTRDDDGAVSTWSTLDSVLVNYVEDPPTPFTLQSPRVDSLVVELDSLEFIWAASSDPDWKSSILYRFELFPEKGEKFTAETPDTFYTFRGGLINEINYRWSVIAVDNTGLETAVRTGFSFSTNTTPMAPVAAAMPVELMPPDPLQFRSTTDPNPADKLTYTVEIAPDTAFSQVLVHVEEIPHLEGVITATLGKLSGQENLTDDRDYFFRVRATDNHGYHGAYSEPVQFRFNRQNDPPEPPVDPFSPIDSVVIRNQRPHLAWSASSDEDLTDPSESLVYVLQLDYDGEFINDDKFEYTTEAGIIEFDVPDMLKDNTLWFWRVRARDDDDSLSNWATVHPFLVNIVEDPPTVPQLTTPASGKLLNYLGPIGFSWVSSEDIDFMSSITYRIEYTTSPDLSGAAVVEGLTEPVYEAPYPLENTTYYWRVIAVDNTGLETSSEIDSFTLDTRPSIPEPLTPQPAPPIPIAELLTDGEMTWSKAKDPNPADKITYTVQVGVELEPEGIEVVFAEGIGQTTISVAAWKDDLRDNHVYKWQVKSVDEHGIESDWSDHLTFFYNSVNDNPGAVSGVLTPSDDLEVSSIELGWGNAEDADISDPPERISYLVEMTMDPEFRIDVVPFNTRQGETTLVPTEIQDDRRWFWRVRAVDDETAEGPVSPAHAFIYNIANDPPDSIPGLISPVEAKEVSTITLNWKAATDRDLTDSASIGYRVELCMDRNFRTEIVEVMTEPMVTGASPTGLQDDSWWFWRVRAVDDDGAEGPVTETRGLTFNSQNDPPGPVASMNTPAVDEEVEEISLSWGIADDRDISDSTVTLSYLLELSLEEDFSGEVQSRATQPGVTEAKPTGLRDDSYWYWRVRAVDDDGVQGPVSDARRLIYNTKNDPPGVVPSLLKPAEGEEVAVSILEWEHASDRDITDPPERLAYFVELCLNEHFTEEVITLKTERGVTTCQPEGLQDDSWWYWCVRAQDDDNVEGPTSSIGSFIYNTSNDAPRAVEVLTAPENGIEVSVVNLQWQPASDKDLTDPPKKLAYRVEFSMNADFSGDLVTVMTRAGKTSAATMDLTDDKTWYWRVVTIDDDRAESPVSVSRSFDYNPGNDPPYAVPGLTSPAPEEEVQSVTLTWEAASDKDISDPSELLTYVVELSLTEDFTGKTVRTATGAGVLTAQPPNLDDDSRWYWHVKAVDDDLAEGPFSEVSSLILNAQNDPPDIVREMLEPADGAEVSVVNLKWAPAFDRDITDPAERLIYVVELCQDKKFSDTIRTVTTQPGAASAKVEGLADDSWWFWCVRAVDDDGAEGPVSTVKSFMFNASNNPPDAVTELMGPEEGTEVSTLKLAWSATTDPDLTDSQDKLSYRVEFTENRAFSGRLETFDTAPGVTIALPRELPDNRTWFWRVIAVDDGGAEGGASPVKSFTLNSRNDPPAPVSDLLQPADDAEITSVTLKWRAGTDPDPFDKAENLTYRVELCNDRSFASGVVSLSTEAGITTITPKELTDNSVWYWRVKAVDDEGLEGAFGTVGSFILNAANDPPAPFELTGPADGAVIESRSVKLTWTASLDVDPGDQVIYEVVVARDENFTTGLGNYRDITGTEFDIPADAIAQGGKLFWKVLASDRKGMVTWGSDSNTKPRSFTVKLPPMPGE